MTPPTEQRNSNPPIQSPIWLIAASWGRTSQVHPIAFDYLRPGSSAIPVHIRTLGKSLICPYQPCVLKLQEDFPIQVSEWVRLCTASFSTAKRAFNSPAGVDTEGHSCICAATMTEILQRSLYRSTAANSCMTTNNKHNKFFIFIFFIFMTKNYLTHTLTRSSLSGKCWAVVGSLLYFKCLCSLSLQTKI